MPSKYQRFHHIIPTIIFFTCWSIIIEAYLKCNEKTGGGICPDKNTCCLMKDGSTGCIPSDMGSYNASCCKDGETGCAVGYTCENECLASANASISDILVRSMPRYRLCNGNGLDQLYGFQIFDSELAYYSSHGKLQDIKTPQMVLIVIHGANRNGDDYFCSSKATVDMQHHFSNVLIIAIQFYSEVDERPNPSFLYWKESTDGPWRSGENSIGPDKISSFDALDKMVRYIFHKFPSLMRLTVVGHSSGGQFVQRWALLTSEWIYDKTHVVTANPSSYAYLSPYRLMKGKWAIPANNECPLYNSWEWGSQSDKNMLDNNPYVYKKLQNTTQLIKEYHNRNVYYLVGSQDRCNITNDDGWCHSHGLEVTCMDELQGTNRLERSNRYMLHLREEGIGDNHVHFMVNNVGHDHALMFQSKEGLDALFWLDGNTKIFQSEIVNTT